MDNTRLAVRASNLAREWVEMVYNLRDSNWKKYSWNKDWHRLDSWAWWSLSAWFYVFSEDMINWDNYIYVDSISPSDPDDFYTIEWFFSDAYDTEREASKLIFTGTYSYYTWWTLETGWNLTDLLNVDWLSFYRVLRVYDKQCKIASCSKDSDPWELRFCVKVFYRNIQWQHASELCSIMTNFME